MASSAHLFPSSRIQVVLQYIQEHGGLAALLDPHSMGRIRPKPVSSAGVKEFYELLDDLRRQNVHVVTGTRIGPSARTPGCGCSIYIPPTPITRALRSLMAFRRTRRGKLSWATSVMGWPTLLTRARNCVVSPALKLLSTSHGK